MYRIVEFSHYLINDFLNSFSKDQNLLCIDATLGNGNDALYIIEKASKFKIQNCQVIGYEIQDLAIRNTMEKVEKLKISNLIIKKQSHEFIDENDINLVIFNLGYLPGGSKEITTHASSTIKALKNLLPRMHQQMLIIIAVYIGHQEGYEEHLLIDDFVKNLESHDYFVTKFQNYNHPSSPYLITITHNKKSKI